VPSHANFILGRSRDATRIYDGLLRRGVMCGDERYGIRARANHVGLPEENRRLIAALSPAMGK